MAATATIHHAESAAYSRMTDLVSEGGGGEKEGWDQGNGDYIMDEDGCRGKEDIMKETRGYKEDYSEEKDDSESVTVVEVMREAVTVESPTPDGEREDGQVEQDGRNGLHQEDTLQQR